MNPKKLSFKVEWRHINKGERGNGLCCPIALAIREMGFKNVSVSSGLATMEKKGVQDAYLLSEKAVNFICNFDNNRDVKSIQLDLEYAFLSI